MLLPDQKSESRCQPLPCPGPKCHLLLPLSSSSPQLSAGEMRGKWARDPALSLAGWLSVGLPVPSPGGWVCLPLTSVVAAGPKGDSLSDSPGPCQENRDCSICVRGEGRLPTELER